MRGVRLGLELGERGVRSGSRVGTRVEVGVRNG